ncbi:YjbQ family protein [Aeromonas enteropelogenes]|uniref:YjbQ family protein n=1 Tax=Aeromonas enteropelogenes TaxID=29489 RepID=UPI003987CB70
MWQQRLLTLKPRSRGFHLVTDELVAKLPELADYRVGMAHLLLQHTSASLTLNENCDPSVRADMEVHLHRLALGTWQGIWLGEHRIDGGARKILVTLQGE